MGSLIGHVVPGTFFALFAIWWAYEFLWKYFTCRLTGKRYTSNPRFADPRCRTVRRRRHPAWDTAAAATANGRKQPSKSRPGLLSYAPPLEITFKFVSIVIGILGEYFTGLDENWHFVKVHHGQHMTMFAFFWFASIFELMYFYRVPALPPHMDLVAGAIAFVVEGILFLWHLAGRDNLDIQVHTFLVYTIVFSAASMTLEIFVKDDIRAPLLRSYSTLLQGAWFYAVGFILYPPEGWGTWDPESHAHGMIVTMMFTWHAAGAMLFLMILAAFVYRSVKRDLLRSKAVVFDEDDDDELSAGRDMGAAMSNGGGNGVYTRLAQSDEVAVKLLRDDDDEEDDD